MSCKNKPDSTCIKHCSRRARFTYNHVFSFLTVVLFACTLMVKWYATEWHHRHFKCGLVGDVRAHFLRENQYPCLNVPPLPIVAPDWILVSSHFVFPSMEILVWGSRIMQIWWDWFPWKVKSVAQSKHCSFSASRPAQNSNLDLSNWHEFGGGSICLTDQSFFLLKPVLKLLKHIIIIYNINNIIF